MMKTITKTLGILLFTYSGLSGQVLNRPESITYDAESERYVISNYGQGHDGSMAMYDPKTDSLWTFNKNESTGPKGLAIYKGVVYAAESGFINGFDLKSGRRVFNRQVGTAWINDLTVDGSGNLYTGETNTGKIYKVNTDNGAVEEWITSGLTDINGVFADIPNNRLLVVFYKQDSEIVSIDLTTREQTILVSTEYDNLDGITQDGCGNWYVSSQGQKCILRFNPDFSGEIEVFVNDLLKPADIFYNQELDILCIPEIDDSRIEFVEVLKPCVQANLITPEQGATDIQPEQVIFQWDSIRYAEYYRFEIAEDAAFSQVICIEGTPVAEMIISDLEPGKQYFWRIRAYGKKAFTVYSEIGSFTTSVSSSLQHPLIENINRIYPNPSRNTIYIESSSGSMKNVFIYSMMGQCVIEQNVISTRSNQTVQVDISSLSAGQYLCRMEPINGPAKTELIVVMD